MSSMGGRDKGMKHIKEEMSTIYETRKKGERKKKYFHFCQGSNIAHVIKKEFIVLLGRKTNKLKFSTLLLDVRDSQFFECLAAHVFGADDFYAH